MKKFLSSFAGANVLSPEEQRHIKGAGVKQLVCTGKYMFCEIHEECPEVCACVPNGSGDKVCRDINPF